MDEKELVERSRRVTEAVAELLQGNMALPVLFGIGVFAAEVICGMPEDLRESGRKLFHKGFNAALDFFSQYDEVKQ